MHESSKAALAQAKRRGTILGRNCKVLAQANRQSADAFAAHIERFLPPDWRVMMSYSEVARMLNDLGAVSPTGKRFHAQTVNSFAARLLISRNHKNV